MRDPFSWSFPLMRLFGISIRVHILFPIFALVMILRVTFKDPPVPNLWIDASILLAITFVVVLLHELGHCFGARLVDGDAPEVLLWPLGGLAAVEVPHTPRANFIATAAGPGVNLLLCLITAVFLAAWSMRPSLNPWSGNSDPIAPRMYRWSDGLYYGSSYRPGDPLRYTAMTETGAKEVSRAEVEDRPATKETPREFYLKDNSNVRVRPSEETATLTAWQVFAARFFWVNWVLLLLNLLPGFPLDGGRMLQCILWARGDYRQATATAVAFGFGVVFLVAGYGVVLEQTLPLLLALFIYVSCKQQWFLLETGGEESLFGYDFSQGYTSLERDRDQPTATRQQKPNFIQRWLQRRAARRQQREQEEREAEERRLDELLEKVKDNGIQSLTEEERRFLTRVSSRYKNRS